MLKQSVCNALLSFTMKVSFEAYNKIHTRVCTSGYPICAKFRRQNERRIRRDAEIQTKHWEPYWNFQKIVTRVHKRSIWDVKYKSIVATCFCNKTIFLSLKNGKMYLVHLNEDKLVMFEILVIKSCNAKRIKREI